LRSIVVEPSECWTVTGKAALPAVDVSPAAPLPVSAAEEHPANVRTAAASSAPDRAMCDNNDLFTK
jgi:hypothetical protein